MDDAGQFRYFPDMRPLPAPSSDPASTIPPWGLYGEPLALPDVLHIERITDRAAGLDWTIAPHRHPQIHQVFLIIEGQASLTVDGRQHRPRAPFLLNVPSGVVHGFAFSAQTQGFVLTIPVQSVPELLAPSAADKTVLQTAILAPDKDMAARFGRLMAEHARRGPGRGPMLRALATELLCLILRALDRPNEPTAPAPNPRLARFFDLLADHLRDGWKPADYARTLGLSERHLGRLCRAQTGQSAQQLIDSARMHEACRLLAYTRAPIARIAYDLGFDDPSYFSRAFRRIMGLSPGTYRQRLENSGAPEERT